MSGHIRKCAKNEWNPSIRTLWQVGFNKALFIHHHSLSHRYNGCRMEMPRTTNAALVIANIKAQYNPISKCSPSFFSRLFVWTILPEICSCSHIKSDNINALHHFVMSCTFRKMDSFLWATHWKRNEEDQTTVALTLIVYYYQDIIILKTNLKIKFMAAAISK